MKTSRAIVIFPKFSNVEFINEIREKYDPLCRYIKPHITLVFPFESDFSKDELLEHLKNKLKEMNSFELVVKGITGASDGYVFLDVKKGNDEIINLHDKLYSGILKPYHNRFIPYIPHITIGRLNDEKNHNKVVRELSEFEVEFRTQVDMIVVEIIDDKEKSVLEIEYKL